MQSNKPIRRFVCALPFLKQLCILLHLRPRPTYGKQRYTKRVPRLNKACLSFHDWSLSGASAASALSRCQPAQRLEGNASTAARFTLLIRASVGNGK